MEFTESQIYVFILILARSSALIASAPVLGDMSINRRVKIGLAGLLSLAIFPLVYKTAPHIDITLVTAVSAVLVEVAVGLMIGFFLKIVFAAVVTAGQIIGVDMGLAMATVLDPNTNSQISIIAKFLNLLTLMMFIYLNAHHFIIEAFSFSYLAVPFLGLDLSGAALTILTKAAGLIFVLAIKIAAPALVALFLASITMGIAARAVPQMNIFFVAHPIRIGAGLFSLILMMPMFFYVFKKLLLDFEKQLDLFIRAL